METKKCPQCGTGFEGRANKLYCSTNCKMAAFYSTNPRNSSTVNELSTPVTTKPLTDSPSKATADMVTVPVHFTNAEKELLEQQSRQCETVLSKLIRIRSLMDETDIQSMQDTISKQNQQIEELRIKLGFFQGKSNEPEPNKQLTERSYNVILVAMNPKQYEFLKVKYLESYDFEDSASESLPDGTITNNHCDELKSWEQNDPGHILMSMAGEMLELFVSKIEERLVEECGYDAEELEDDPVIDQFDKLR